MKLRSRSDSNSPVVQYTSTHYKADQSWDYDQTHNHIPSGENWWYVGYDIEDYYKRRNTGELLPMTPFERVARNHSSTCTFDITYPDNKRWAGTFGYWSGGYTVTEDELYSTLDSVGYDWDYYVQSAAARIYSNGWDSLTFIAELKKTIDMFTNLGGRIVDLLLSGKLERLWLEGRYGWRTLVYDIMDVAKVLSELSAGLKQTRFSERVGGSQSWTEVTNPQYSTGTSTVTYTKTREWQISTRGSVVADIEPPQFAFNPIVTGWELITLSFVIDWFVNVGQALAAASFLVLEDHHTAAGGVKITCNQTRTISSIAWNSNCSGSITDDSTAHGELFIRTPTSVSYLPQFNVRLDISKIIDLIAIVIGRKR